ncbi:hypothetical protein [Defluviicoccus vanus]|nr:hypothetical protein [Defluviicoccus vanus]
MKMSSAGKAGRINRGVLDSRRERLAAALRDNLRKRKAQARVRVHNAVDEVSEAIDDVLGPVDGDKVPT